MDTNTIIEHMQDAGIKPEICKLLKPILDDLHQTGRDPFMLAVDLVHMASCIVTKSLPPEELIHFGKCLQSTADINMRGGLTKTVLNNNTSNENRVL